MSSPATNDDHDRAQDAEHAAEEIGQSTPVRTLARCGLIAYGLVHLLISWIALHIGWTNTERGNADSSGAMRTLSAQPFGNPLLWSVATGLLFLALWQFCELFWGPTSGKPGTRVRQKATSGARVLVYAALAASAARTATGAASSSSGSEQQATSGVLSWPAGQWLVVTAGLIVAGIGIAMMIKGATTSIGDEIDLRFMTPPTRHFTERLAQAGYITKGIAFGIVGGLLIHAALTSRRQHAQGLDGALQTILAQPFGRILLTAVATGFTCFGAYAMLQARFRRM